MLQESWRWGNPNLARTQESRKGPAGGNRKVLSTFRFRPAGPLNDGIVPFAKLPSLPRQQGEPQGLTGPPPWSALWIPTGTATAVATMPATTHGFESQNLTRPRGGVQLS